MLEKAKIVAFVTTKDAARARVFYEKTLGLRVVEDTDFALVCDANGTTLRIAKAQDVVIAPYTVLGWEVADVPATVRALTDRGVEFSRYGFLEQDALGVWTAPPAPDGTSARVAWFKDPDGNTLSVSGS